MTLFSSVLVALAGLAASENNSDTLYQAQVDQIKLVLDYHQKQSLGDVGGIRFAPVFVSPQMQWAVPNAAISGVPSGPSYPPPQMFPNYPSYPSGPQGYPGYPAPNDK